MKTRKSNHGDVKVTKYSPEEMEKYCREHGLSLPGEKKKNTFLAVYKGEEVLCVGSPQECADSLGVKLSTIQFYLTASYRKRVASRKDPANAIQVFRIEEDEED